MNSQGKQIVINAIYRVIYSAPKPYNQNFYPYYNQNNLSSNDIMPQQFEIWRNYVFEVLDISYSNLPLYSISSAKERITQFVLQFNQYNQCSPNKIPYVQLVDQINNELLYLIQLIT